MNTTSNMTTLVISEYKLMYFFGTWVTKEVLYAESNAEAIHDADEVFNNSDLANWQYGVALFKEGKNTPVKVYKPNK